MNTTTYDPEALRAAQTAAQAATRKLQKAEKALEAAQDALEVAPVDSDHSIPAADVVVRIEKAERQAKIAEIEASRAETEAEASSRAFGSLLSEAVFPLVADLQQCSAQQKEKLRPSLAAQLGMAPDDARLERTLGESDSVSAPLYAAEDLMTALGWVDQQGPDRLGRVVFKALEIINPPAEQPAKS